MKVRFLSTQIGQSSCLLCGALTDDTTLHEYWHNALETRLFNLEPRSLVSSGEKIPGAPKARGRERSDRESNLKLSLARDVLEWAIEAHNERVQGRISGLHLSEWGVCDCDLAEAARQLSRALKS